MFGDGGVWRAPILVPFLNKQCTHNTGYIKHIPVIYYNIFNIQYLKEMEVSYTHSFSCLVSFLTGQHVATHLFGSSMAKTGCRRCPLVSPSLFKSSVVFVVLLLKSIGYQPHLLLFDRFWGFHFIGCQVPQTWHACRCVGRDL